MRIHAASRNGALDSYKGLSGACRYMLLSPYRLITPMYTTCPKCHHTRNQPSNTSQNQCPACGLIFSKWMKQQFKVEQRLQGTDHDDSESFIRKLLNTLLYVPDKTDRLVLAGRALLFIIFSIWGWTFIWMNMQSNEIGHSFMHHVNLVFHEAGHVVFRPFGRFMTIIGGSLLQLLIPVAVIVTMVWKNRDNFGASLGLWWLAQSIMDLAPYINDARAGQLMLLGGVTGQDMPGVHDWRNILSELGLLQADHAIATLADVSGELLMLLSFIWGGYILYLQYQTIRHK